MKAELGTLRSSYYSELPLNWELTWKGRGNRIAYKENPLDAIWVNRTSGVRG